MEVLENLEATRKEYWNIKPEGGQLLGLLIKISGAKRVLELGTSNGYSTLWMSLTGVEIVTMEKWEERIEEAKKNFAAAGVDVKLIEGDILENLPKVEGKFDFVFVDAKKNEHYDYLMLLKGRLNEGAVIVTDNVTNMEEPMKNYLDYLRSNFESLTIPIGGGMEVTLIEKF